MILSALSIVMMDTPSGRKLTKLNKAFHERRQAVEQQQKQLELRELMAQINQDYHNRWKQC